MPRRALDADMTKAVDVVVYERLRQYSIRNYCSGFNLNMELNGLDGQHAGWFPNLRPDNDRAIELQTHTARSIKYAITSFDHWATTANGRVACLSQPKL